MRGLPSLTQPQTHILPLTVTLRTVFTPSHLSSDSALAISASFVTPKGFSTYLERENQNNVKMFLILWKKNSLALSKQRLNDKNITIHQTEGSLHWLARAHRLEGAYRNVEGESLDWRLRCHLDGLPSPPFIYLTATDQAHLSGWNILPDSLGMPLTRCVNHTNQFKSPDCFWMFCILCLHDKNRLVFKKVAKETTRLAS